MKIFYCLPVVVLCLAFTPVEEVSTNKFNYFKEILSSTPWQQSAFTVSPALQVGETTAVNDLYYLQDETTRNSIIKFDASGIYYIVLGKSTLENTVFAARSGQVTANKETVQNDDFEAIDVTEKVQSNILETGSWQFNDKGDLILIADNGRMKEQVLKVELLGEHQLIINFTQEISGEYHTFTQVFESKPFLDIGW